MPRIRVLPESVANKIAAGEVIERPASVVKELVENALDAEATQIDIAVEEGGKRLIRVSDNGAGMDAEDLALAFASHATSKLASAEDLFAIQTLGFRGEALASVGAVAQGRMVSRPRGAASGAEVSVNGGVIGQVRACGAPEGTTVEVRNLFFNVPARRKFLKSATTEIGHIAEVVTRMALCYPSVRFHLSHNDRPVLALAPVKEPLERIGALFGEEVSGALVRVGRSVVGLEISAYIAPPKDARLNAKLQYIFLNGRYIRDRFIFAAISQAYQGFLMQGRFPVVFLFLKMDAALVDVNVHPTKIEVRFRNSNEVFQEVRDAIAGGLKGLAAPVRPRATPAKPAARSTEPPQTMPVFKGLDETPKPREESIRRAMADFFAGAHARPGQPKVGTPRQPGAPPAAPGTGTAPPPAPALPSAPNLHPPSRRGSAFQLHNAYILEETEEGIQIIDQHALHERILREALEARIREARVLSQRLLVPATVHLTPKEFIAIMGLKEGLARIGVDFTEFGQNTIAIHAMPQMLDRYDPAQFVQDILDELGTGREEPTLEQRLDAIINLAACKGAVKAGQPLSPEQIRGLLEQRERLKSPSVCAHGRPSTILLTFEYLEKQFART